jgi:hypothetical protein
MNMFIDNWDWYVVCKIFCQIDTFIVVKLLL